MKKLAVGCWLLAVSVATAETNDSMKGAVGTPPEPSGAVSADFDKVAIIDGTAYLGVSVKTNNEVKARGEGWGKVNVQPGDVTVENGSVINAVPANAEKGFMVLQSGDAVGASLNFKDPLSRQ